MNITLPILLLVVGALTFWILNESKLKWYVRTALIASFCAFTIFFYIQIHSFLGWAADPDDIPDKVSIHWIIIKEPNKILKFDGKIYILIESVDQDKGLMHGLFGYNQQGIEPRLHEMEYTRDLHEQLEGLKDKLKSGQPVIGRLLKEPKKPGISKEGKEGSQKGDGSESQDQEWHFHELRPSDLQPKPTK